MMRQISRDVWLAALLFVALGIILFFSVSRQQEEVLLPPLAANSNQPDGARALLLWMEELGYKVEHSSGAVYAIPEGTDLMLVLEPSLRLRSERIELLDEWVEEGGTLVLVGSSLPMMAWMRHFHAAFRFSDVEDTIAITPTLAMQTPLWNSPPPDDFLHHSDVVGEIVPTGLEEPYIVHLANGAEPVLVVFDRGNGRVILSTAVYPFTNAGLQDEGNPEFVLNVLAQAGEPGAVWYDDWHHGIHYEPSVPTGVGFSAWLRTSRVGRALLLAGLIIFVALVLRGRSFGRPVPLQEQRARRTPLEYVTAMANLHRRAHHRSALLQDYHTRLKRDYARRYHLSPTQPDDKFVAELAAFDPLLDKQELTRLLSALSNPDVNEEQAVQLATEAVDWMENRASHRATDLAPPGISAENASDPKSSLPGAQ